jgi:hypothetical protein
LRAGAGKRLAQPNVAAQSGAGVLAIGQHLIGCGSQCNFCQDTTFAAKFLVCKLLHTGLVGLSERKNGVTF